MKSLNYLVILLALCPLVLSSCSSDDGDDSENCAYNWAAGVQDEVTAISNAIVAYNNDQSTANCNVLKAAYQNYIDALKPYGDCSLLTGTDRQEFEEALEEAEDELPTLCD